MDKNSVYLQKKSLMNGYKKIPYGQSNFEKIRTENYIYVDKTRFIEQIENEMNSYHFLIRPRKFGKSLFLSTLRNYYDICKADKYDVLFGDLYIGKNPTPKRNSLFVIKFSFSGLNTCTVDEFKASFYSAIRGSIQFFLTEHAAIIDNYAELKKEAWKIDNIRGQIEFAFDIISTYKSKAYIIIDEYDHFANDLIAQGTNLSVDQYKQLIWANGVVRDFYETLKDNTETVVDTIFITGITPMMLDDVTSGFNISNNLSTDLRYHEILGFTEEEVEFLIDECGVDRTKLTVDRKFLYNGYKFHENAANKLYNSAMILYFLNQVNITEGEVKYLIDDNLKTDYGRIKNLLGKPESIEKIEEIVEHEQIPSEIVTRFSIDRLHDSENFLSLLYYMGLLTIDKDPETKVPVLRIPNYSTKTMYWEYIRNILKTINPQLSHNEINYYASLKELAIYGNPEEFIKFIQKFYVSILSNRDYRQFDEKYVKAIILTLLFQGNFYLPVSEYETSGGYCDIYLQRRNLNPHVNNDWVWEIKYIKEADANKKTLIENAKTEALTQLQRYKSSNLFKDRTDVKYLAVVFIGKKGYWIEEIKN